MSIFLFLGGIALANLIKRCRKITYLDVNHNLIGDPAGEAFIEAISINKNFKTLIYDKNLINFDFCIELENLLEKN